MGLAAVPQEHDFLGEPHQTKALVLGDRLTAEAIARSLELAGIEPVFAPNRFPDPKDPGALGLLRQALLNFRGQAGPEEMGSPHLIHPGTSPWAERPELVQIGEQLGFSVVAPPARCVALFGNHLSLIRLADQLAVPHLVSSFEPIHSQREVLKLVEENYARFPLILKAIRGGGPTGLLTVHSPEELLGRFPVWQAQLEQAQGESIVFAERFVEGGQHACLPFFRGKTGELHFFPWVDHTLQTRFRRLIEFSGEGIGFQSEAEEKMLRWSRAILEKCDYVGLGILEWMVEGPQAFLLGGMPRLNTSFGLWERVAGTQAVHWQLCALSPGGGDRSEWPKCTPDRQWNTGIGLSLYSEDPVLGLPEPGFVREATDRSRWKMPGGIAELKLAVHSEQPWSWDQSPLLGWIWAGALNKEHALILADRILNEVWIAGGLSTNERYLSEILSHPWVQAGTVHAGFLDEEFIPEIQMSPEMLQLFTWVVDPAETLQPVESKVWMVGTQRSVPLFDRILWKWTHPAEEWFSDQGLKGRSGQLAHPETGAIRRVCVYPLAEGMWRVRIGKWTRVVRLIDRTRSLGLRLTSLCEGRVHSVRYRAGSEAPAHQGIVWIEAHRQLVPHAVGFHARIGEWWVREGDVVRLGQGLAQLEKIG